MIEFDKYTRDELIAEVRAIRLKFYDHIEIKIKDALSETKSDINSLFKKIINECLMNIESDINRISHSNQSWLRERKYYRDDREMYIIDNAFLQIKSLNKFYLSAKTEIEFTSPIVKNIVERNRAKAIELLNRGG